MSAHIWHKGPPPHVGWWNASPRQDPDDWRWWNGVFWSVAAYTNDSGRSAAHFARGQTGCEHIEWSDYWPENARVPRLDSTDGDWTFNTTGMQPVGGSIRVDVVFRGGDIHRGLAANTWYWGVIGNDYDILAWRLAK